MTYVEDPTAFQAMSNVISQKYRKPNEEYRNEIPPVDNRITVALCRSAGIHHQTVVDTFVSPYTNIISLRHTDVTRIMHINFSKKFPGSSNLEIVSMHNNIIKLNVKVPRGVEVSVKYTYRVY